MDGRGKLRAQRRGYLSSDVAGYLIQSNVIALVLEAVDKFDFAFGHSTLLSPSRMENTNVSKPES